MNISKRSKFIVSLAAIFSSPLLLANTLEGRITDYKNLVYFEGAQVRLEELNKTVVSKRDGTFRFDDLPVGQYTLTIIYLGADKVTKRVDIVAGHTLTQNITLLGEQAGKEDGIEEVIVVGQRAGQAGALNREKNALSLKSIVSSDNIGQLPDQNAAEALQRLPGMFIQRDQGEGRFVGIRGIDPNLNNVTINGVNVPSPEAGVRSVAMDVIPSELVQSIEVSKSVTPDMDASAVGGSIDVKSLSAFDRKGQSYSITTQASYNEQVSETSPKLSASYTNTFALSNDSQLGVATAFSWFERKFGSNNIETDDGWGDIEVEDKDSGDDIEIFGAEEIEQRHYQITRERLGAAINLDLHTSSTDKYYFRTLWSEFSDDEFRLRNEYKFAKGQVDTSTVTNTFAEYVDANMDRDTKDRLEVQKIMSMVVGGENQLDNWFVEYNLGYSKASEKEPDRVDVVFEGKGLDLGYQNSGPTPVLTQSSSAHELNNFDLDKVEYSDNLTEDETNSLKIDLTNDFVLAGYNSQFKWGTKYSTRKKFNDVNMLVYDGGFNDATAAQFASNSPDYSLGDFGPGLSQKELKQFILSNRGQFDINQNDSQIESLGASYLSDEDVLAAYAMITLEIEDWTVVAGLRYEDTQFSTKGNKVELVVDDINDTETLDINPWQVGKNYDYFLPSVNIKYDINDKLIARFAYTHTIARPTFGDSAAFQLIETETTEDNGVIEIERKAKVGNPDLDPYKSTNIDFSVEYYPGHIGVLSAGLFYKDIDNFIIEQEVQDNGQWQGFEEVIQAVNGEAASLTGLELAWVKNFQSGLMYSLNGTFINADEELPNQADTVANLMLGYENDRLSARLSVSYKSENFQFKESGREVYEDAHKQLDFSFKYYFGDTIQVYFNAINLTDEPFYLYHGSKVYNYQYEVYGQSFELGITLTSF